VVFLVLVLLLFGLMFWIASSVSDLRAETQRMARALDVLAKAADSEYRTETELHAESTDVARHETGW